jgi:hypothetical protein
MSFDFMLDKLLSSLEILAGIAGTYRGFGGFARSR